MKQVITQILSRVNYFELLSYILIHLVHKILLPRHKTFKSRHDYKIVLIRNVVLLLEFILLFYFYKSITLVLYILLFMACIIIPNSIKIFMSRRTIPEFVLISSQKDRIGVKNPSIKYKWIIDQEKDLDTKYLEDILHHVKPDALLLHNLEPEAIRLTLLNRRNCKVLYMDNFAVRKLQIADLLRPNRLYVEQKSLKRIAIILQGTEIDAKIKEVLDKNAIEWIEINKKWLRENKLKGYDAVVDFTCTNGSIYKPHKIELINYLLRCIKKTELKLFTFTPLTFSNKTNEVYTRIYEVLIQQYRNTQIIRTPAFLFDKITLNNTQVQSWTNIDDIPLYLNYVATHSNDRTIEFNHGEYFLGQDLKILLEELATM